MTTIEKIKNQMLAVEPLHYTHFPMENYRFEDIVEAIEEIHASKLGLFTCKRIDFAHLYIVRRDR